MKETNTVPQRSAPQRRQPGQRRQRGATMVELLVSVLLFALGTLGMIGMMTKTLGYSQVSLFRSQAVALTDDIIDSMRADPVNARKGDWHTEFGDTAANFSGTTVAQKDLSAWKSRIDRLLPAGQGEIIVSSGSVTVKIKWKERDGWATLPTTSLL